jgi:hypothetical protein
MFLSFAFAFSCAEIPFYTLCLRTDFYNWFDSRNEMVCQRFYGWEASRTQPYHSLSPLLTVTGKLKKKNSGFVCDCLIFISCCCLILLVKLLSDLLVLIKTIKLSDLLCTDVMFMVETIPLILFFLMLIRLIAWFCAWLFDLILIWVPDIMVPGYLILLYPRCWFLWPGSGSALILVNWPKFLLDLLSY